MKMYKDGAEAETQDDQVEYMEAAGWSKEQPVKKVPVEEAPVEAPVKPVSAKRNLGKE